MSRALLAALSALALAGCVVRHVTTVETLPAEPAAPPPEPAPVVWYHGPHYIPEDVGGGWCYEEGAHTHPYFPDRPDVYVVERGYYTYDGPSIFLYVGGHPLPGGGWCYLTGPHEHDYYPPPRAGFVWHRGHGYYYEGPYRPHHAPPPSYWPRPVRWHRVPPPSSVPTVTAPAYRPPRSSPSAPPPRVAPATSPDRSDDRPRIRGDGHERTVEPGRYDEVHAPDRARVDERDRTGEPAGDRVQPDRERRYDRRMDPAPSTPAPPPPAGQDPRRARNVDQPAMGPGAARPAPKEHDERGAVRRPGGAADRREDAGHERKDADRPAKDDDGEDANGRPARPRR